ncbi:MAG: hypothetical protein M1130_01495 [Actinobacteria bacterium]|nr:hypothetical protein [Actinomycetota bacterium]
MSDDSNTARVISNREKQLIKFIRELGWGEVRIRVENGQPVLIYEAIKTVRLDDQGPNIPHKPAGRKIGGHTL